MYTLFTLDGSRAIAVEMVLAEAELPYEVRIIEISKNEHLTAEYLSVNPRGTIPALVDDDGEVVCETVAAMLFLTDKHVLEELAPVSTDPERGVMLDWLVYHATEVQEPVKRYYYAHRHAEDSAGQTRVKKRAVDVFAQRWQLVEDHLRTRGPYHLGNRFSIVDLYLLTSAAYCNHLSDGEFPAIENCMELVAARTRVAPLWKRHLKGLSHIVNAGMPK